MIQGKYAGLREISLAAKPNDWKAEPPSAGASTGWWVHDGQRLHVADNVGEYKAAFISAANPKVVIGMIDDLDREAELRAAAERELIDLRRENEILRNGVKGDFDLDAWLVWCVEQKKQLDGDIDPAFEAAEHAAFEDCYVKLHYAGEKHVLKVFPALFMRWEGGAGAYVIEQIQREWLVWWNRALNLARVEGHVL